jgi:hypothetical protein
MHQRACSRRHPSPFQNFLENGLSKKRTACAQTSHAPKGLGNLQGFLLQAAENLKLPLNIQDQIKNFKKLSCWMPKPRPIQWRQSQAYPVQSGRTVPLKGQCHEIFDFRLGFLH